MLHLARRVPWLITRRLRRRFDAPLLLYTSGCNDYEYRSGPLNSLLVLTNFARKEIRRLDELVKESNGKQISRSGVLKVVDNIGSSLQAMRCISERDEVSLRRYCHVVKQFKGMYRRVYVSSTHGRGTLGSDAAEE